MISAMGGPAVGCGRLQLADSTEIPRIRFVRRIQKAIGDIFGPASSSSAPMTPTSGRDGTSYLATRHSS
jgi:hypothetical protein